jgi:2'-hydroxyisoflavone reductase
LKILILGGTVFLGRQLAQAAVQAGHAVSLFNRGQNNPQLFDELENLRGDRDGHLEALANRKWDSVIDTCGYFPRLVGDSVRLLADAVKHYTFISSVSVYEESFHLPLDEDAKVKTIADETVEKITGDTYGALKFLCERETQKTMPGRSLIVRPGLIVGPFDPSDRFAYWVRRVAKGGDILAPGLKDASVQLIDVRDLAKWIIGMIERYETGVYNATGPQAELSMETFLNTCLSTCLNTSLNIGLSRSQSSCRSSPDSSSGSISKSSSDLPVPSIYNLPVQSPEPNAARLVWIDDKQLVEAGVEPWSELPLWVPVDSIDRCIHGMDSRRAQAKGLAYRPLTETVADTVIWDRSRDQNLELKAGLSRQKEQELLEKCKTA